MRKSHGFSQRSLYPVLHVAILAAMLAGGCSRKESGKENPAAGSAPTAQVPAATSAKDRVAGYSDGRA